MAALISLGIILYCMRVWEMNINIPVDVHGGDGALALSICKSIYDYGLKGLFFCKSLGAPDISSLIDIPFVDTDFAIEVWLLSKALPSANAVYYVDYFLTFPLAAVTMYLLSSRLTDNNSVKLFISICFAITPYHFVRNMNHQTLSHYYMIPIAIYLMLIVFEEDFTAIVPTRYLIKKQRWKIAIMYGGCLVLGFSNVYYAFFGLLCMAVGCLAKFIIKKNTRILIKEAVPLYIVLLSVLYGLMPKIIYTLKHGSNLVAVQRLPWECEVYALKIIQLLLPCSYNNVEWLRNIYDNYTSNAFNINENTSASLGLVASVGFMIICVWIIVRLISQKHQVHNINYGRMGIISLTTLVVVLYAVGGGFGTFINYWITSEIRCFNRSSIFIACMSLCMIALFVNYISEKLHERYNKVVEAVILILILLFSLYSETIRCEKGWQEELKEQNKILTSFFADIEGDLEEGSMIYELPFMRFPEEGGINNMSDYEPITGYLYSDKLRWSYGGVKGRNTSAEDLYTDDGMSMVFVDNILNAGFSGVYIDTLGYEDGGDAVVSYYKNTLGLTPIVSEDGWLYFFNIENVTIDKNQLIPGYLLIYNLAQSVGITLSSAEIADTTEKIMCMDEKGYETIYSWLESAGKTDGIISDEDYIRWLYLNVLLRDPTDEEIEYWADKIATGAGRYDIMKEFLYCEEFLSKYSS